MQWREQLVEVPGRGLRLHVRRVVDPPAPAMLLLHGLGVGGAIWQAFARRLLPGFAAVAPDLRGHAESDAPPDGYTPTDYALDLLPLIEAEAMPVPVVGHSLGALVGLKLGELHPKAVPWLVLLDPPLDPTIRNREVEDVYRLRKQPAGELEAYLLQRNPGGGELLAQSLARFFRQASDAAFEAMLALWPFDASISVDMPMLVIQADPATGGVLGDAAAQTFTRRQPRAQLVKIRGASHALHASQPGPTAAAILRFAEGYSSDASSPSR